jgi:hypothetical protein
MPRSGRLREAALEREQRLHQPVAEAVARGQRGAGERGLVEQAEALRPRRATR